jgi:Domain of unknown function (DUF5615)
VKVLLDECVDRRLAGDIRGHDVKTVPEAGWAAFSNGELLARAQHEFDVFVTVDRNLPFQRDLSRFSLAVIVLRAPSNRIVDLRSLVPQLLAALPVAERGAVTWIGGSG